MITLATLHKATAQEVADQIVQHLLTQKVAAIDADGVCQYRVKVGDDTVLICAAGCIIGDDEYLLEMEGNVWGDLVLDELAPSYYREIIEDFQGVHDSSDPVIWPIRLRQVCDEYGLKFNPPADYNNQEESKTC